MTRIVPVTSRAHKRAFIELPYSLYRDDPQWVPPLRDEVNSLITPGKNPWFGHGHLQLFLALDDQGKVEGRISAHIDDLALAQPVEQGFGPGTGFWGLMEAATEEVAHALIRAAEDWLKTQGMHRAIGPMSLSIWDEPGLLIQGHDHPPTVMMGHHRPEYQAWIEAVGYLGVKDLYTYEVDISQPFPGLVSRIITSGERNARINIRKVDKSRFNEEASLVLSLLNDAWSDNWGFIPLTSDEIAYVGKKLKSIVYEDLIRVAEVDGEPVAFMITLPDVNEKIAGYGGSLLPFNWAKLLWWLRAPKARTMRVPLMGVAKKMQATRLASQLAFMMIEYIRRDAVKDYGSSRGEIGWVLEDNQGMRAIAEMIESKINKVYRIYARSLS
ncbi:N-acetyltransferase [Aquisediminimonas sediminicola]|uniref:N-acetyltransferase n=1 Tax=Alteraquisediminimonas sediminicola TaxID=2676787 RepID=UPI001C8DFC58|nr:N-acetyltransferase [Aquisediminimonas sediminicola]